MVMRHSLGHKPGSSNARYPVHSLFGFQCPMPSPLKTGIRISFRVFFKTFLLSMGWIAPQLGGRHGCRVPRQESGVLNVSFCRPFVYIQLHLDCCKGP